MKGDTQSTPHGEYFARRNIQWLLSQWVCPNPTSLSPQIRSTAQKQIWGSIPPTREQSRYHHKEGSENHRAIGKMPSISRASSGHCNPIKAQIKGIRAQTSGPTSPTKLQTPEEDYLGYCSRQNRDHRQKTGQNEMAKK